MQFAQSISDLQTENKLRKDVINFHQQSLNENSLVAEKQLQDAKDTIQAQNVKIESLE